MSVHIDKLDVATSISINNNNNKTRSYVRVIYRLDEQAGNPKQGIYWI